MGAWSHRAWGLSVRVRGTARGNQRGASPPPPKASLGASQRREAHREARHQGAPAKRGRCRAHDTHAHILYTLVNHDLVNKRLVHIDSVLEQCLDPYTSQSLWGGGGGRGFLPSTSHVRQCMQSPATTQALSIEMVNDPGPTCQSPATTQALSTACPPGPLDSLPTLPLSHRPSALSFPRGLPSSPSRAVSLSLSLSLFSLT